MQPADVQAPDVVLADGAEVGDGTLAIEEILTGEGLGLNIKDKVF